MNTTKNSPPRKRWFCCLILALCAAVPLLMIGLLLGGVLFLFWMPAPALVISEETTRITGPLTAEGHIDFFKALEERTYPPEFATDENGFRIFVRTFGDVGDYHGYGLSDEDREFYRRQKYEKLGLDPDMSPTLVFPDTLRKVWEDFYKAEEAVVPRLNMGDRPWTLEEYPMFADWINEVDVPLDAIAEMIRKPVFFFPLLQSRESVESGKPQNMIHRILPDVQQAREIAQMFQARATFRISQGNIDGAIDDKLTLLRLGRQVAQTASVIQYLGGLAIEGMAWAMPVGANPEHPLTERQIRRILAGLAALPPLPPLTETLERERYATLSAVQSVMRNPDSLIDYRPVYFISSGSATTTSNSVPTIEDIEAQQKQQAKWDPEFRLQEFVVTTSDSNVVFRRINELYDVLHEPSGSSVLESLLRSADMPSWELFFRVFTSGGRGNVAADILASWLFPPMQVLEQAIQRSECRGNMQHLTFAILLYQLEHGTMPGENWTAQIEKYLDGNTLRDGAEQYFVCPMKPTPKGETRYAMIQYGAELPTSPDTLLLIRLLEAVALDKAVITVDEVLERAQTPSSFHVGGLMVAYRNSTVRYLPFSTTAEEWLCLLGREETSEQPDIQPNIQPIIQAIEEAFGAVERDADGTVIGVDLALERASATDEVLKLALTLPNLRKFRLAGGTISAETFVGMKTQSDLEELFLQDLSIRDEEFLSVVSVLPKLTRLTLRRMPHVSDTGIIPLFQIPALRQLALIEIPITGVSLQAIGETSTLAVLDVRNCSQLVADDYNHILRLPRLVDLRIGGFAVNDLCLEIVAQLPALRALTLGDSLVSAKGFETFVADSLSAGTLETLVLNRNMALNDEALLVLGNLPRLRRLTLNDAMITGAFLERLAEEEEKRPKFNDLSLRKTLLHEDRLAVLAQYPELRSLQLSGVALSKSGVEMLRSLAHIERLDLTDCFFDEEAERYWQESR